jgi:hypothetical protein
LGSQLFFFGGSSQRSISLRNGVFSLALQARKQRGIPNSKGASMSTHDDFQGEGPTKQGMSSTAKVLLILGSIAGVCLLVCCGGVAVVGWKFQGAFKNFAENLTTKDPNEIRARTAEIVHIDIPDAFPPMQAFDLMVMKQIIYGKPNGGSMIVIVEINRQMQGGQTAAGAKQQRQEILRQMRQQHQGQQPGNINAEMNEESNETREFTINGEKVPFEFIKGSANGAPTRQVVGVFAGRNGTTIMLMLMAPESEYDEAAVVKMIESIRLADEDDDESDSVPDMQKGAAPEGGSEPAEEKPAETGAPSEATP